MNYFLRATDESDLIPVTEAVHNALVNSFETHIWRQREVGCDCTPFTVVKLDRKLTNKYFIVIDGAEYSIAHALWKKLWDDELVDHCSLIELQTGYTVEWLGRADATERFTTPRSCSGSLRT